MDQQQDSVLKENKVNSYILNHKRCREFTNKTLNKRIISRCTSVRIVIKRYEAWHARNDIGHGSWYILWENYNKNCVQKLIYCFIW